VVGGATDTGATAAAAVVALNGIFLHGRDSAPLEPAVHDPGVDAVARSS
jgi:hypothetical protein